MYTKDKLAQMPQSKDTMKMLAQRRHTYFHKNALENRFSKSHLVFSRPNYLCPICFSFFIYISSRELTFELKQWPCENIHNA